MEELLAASDFSDCSAQAVILKESAGFAKAPPFPCYILDSVEKILGSAYQSINYSDVLKMVFEADTIIS